MSHDNHIYNLMEQLVQEQKSLWRIEKNYPSDAGDCESCKKFWEEMKEDKKEHIAEMTEMLKNHLG